MTFSGFPRRTRFTPVPNPMFGPLLEQIDDLSELRCTLRVIWLLHQKKGFPRYLTSSDLRSDPTLARVMGGSPSERKASLNHALARAVGRGTLIMGTVQDGEGKETVFALNTDADRRSLAEIQTEVESGEIDIGNGSDEECVSGADRPNVYALYEENIGILTPIIAEELRKSEEDYPLEWIEEAIREAVKSNARSWRYVSHILERWEIEGRTDGRPEGYSSKAIRKSYY